MALTVYEHTECTCQSVTHYVPVANPPADDTPSVGSAIGALVIGGLAILLIGALLGSNDK